jgi:hypothetical protein
MAILGILLVAIPAAAQDRNRQAAAPTREIHIPTQQELERDVFSSPRNTFSTIDRTADGEMERMDREIDRAVMSGICSGC